jgi:hypothetical protein
MFTLYRRPWFSAPMNRQQTLMLALFIALGAVLATGLIVVPAVEEVNADCKPKKNKLGFIQEGPSIHEIACDKDKGPKDKG